MVVHRLLVPDNSGERVLMLMRHPERVAYLVDGRGQPVVVLIEPPAEAHRALVDRYVQDIAADIRPRAVAQQEADANLGLTQIVHLDELDTDRHVLPLLECLANHGSLLGWHLPPT